MQDDFSFPDFDDDTLTDVSSFHVLSPTERGGRDSDGAREARDPNTPDEEAIIAACISSRIYFAEVVLGVVLEDWQYDVLEALDAGETRISIRSGNGAGKTFLLAIIILHYILFRNDVKVPVTAPSSGQLQDGLIPETRKWMKELPDFLRCQISTTKDRIFRVDSPEENFVSFRTARKENPEVLQGIHARFVMCVVDEASGVPDTIYEAAQGTMSTPGSIFIMISNPTRLSGYFYKSHNRGKAGWRTFHVTSFDTSRVDQAFVDQIERDYGKNSDQYRVKVLGEFPSREENTLIGNDVVRAAFRRNIAVTEGTRRVWGLDVGRGGDVSALVERAGPVFTMAKTKNYSDTMQTVGWVKQLYDSTKLKPEAIYVDSIGIGAGVADRLRELDLPAIDVNVSETASLSGKYVRLRDELWWNLKKLFEGMSCSVNIDEEQYVYDMIENEVCAPLQKFTSSGKDAVESKAEMRARGIQSPNIADAMCLTTAYEGAIGAGASGSGKNNWNKPLNYSPPACVH